MHKEKLKKIPHIISGMVILLHALERFEHGHLSYLLFFVAGIIFLLVAAFHHSIAHRFPKIDILFYSIECLLSFVIAWEYYKDGKNLLQYAYAFAALMQIFAIWMFNHRNKKAH